ncbi:cytochrome P450 [Aspergillus homomorphus CBS 101889]|uniref:Benzoate 4-monooxygenase cytochrome P450 n=1 Tax=Aspergillus homomorphus (strain CBS 101889) TaxID=1450537 RepID=A0A395I242_ASPHC|nr:benzoate 4-monooxygenase cytochrome P450 [Aspergillus homomorphus CBS 101889]RAL13723.1 benzoate 4-monooxygenase cytochrome P450 [Aspergillus homomorphus CBS 101889]
MLSLWLPSLGFTVADHWITLVSSILFCYVMGWILYHLYFSPLAGYPGPFLARISSIPDFYWSLTGRRHLWIARNHQLYGDVVRFRPDGVLFKTPQAYRDIFHAKANVKRSQFYDMMTRHKNDQSTLTGTDPSLHAQKRRVLNTVFSDRSLRAMEPLLESHVARWCELLVDDHELEWSEARKMSEVCDYLVLDVLCDLCFGRAVNTKERGINLYRQIPHTIAFFLRILYPVPGSQPWLDPLVWLKHRGLDWLLGKITPPSVRFLYDFVDESLAQRLDLEARQETRQDMLHYLLRAKDPVTGLPGYTREALEAEAIMLTIAGSDTTSVIMAGFFFYIVRTPHAYTKLVHEIRNTFTTVEEIRGGPTLLASCPYLRACVDEAMRITPAGPSELPRTVLPGGITIDGEFIPEGTTVGVSHWSFYRNEEYFPDPDVYRPERWLVDPAAGVSAEDVARARSSCFPFTAGTTSCAGKNFALLELYMTIARTVWLYDMRLLPGDKTGVVGSEAAGVGEVFEVWDSYISLREGPMVQFRRRREVSII